ncbi:urease accessory protein UreF [Magnetospira sp. QH-2]|uniref:urease accessory protein UreF n=1 Tax=Magnetospira sp. (strain QH-2) TaxID=1288970 RepID=UPI000A9F96AB|nr:urease accessory protein UreF [Magnetospira sp. QH-2]
MLTDQGLSKLMTWLSPNFPVGAFAYSHGLEQAVETGDIKDVESLTCWLEGILRFGAGRLDAALFRAAHEAMDSGDWDRLSALVERADALRGTAEMALESRAQGRAFVDCLVQVWPEPQLLQWREELRGQDIQPAYAVALGAAAALAHVPLQSALVATLNAFAANLVSAVVRLVPLGQTDGQRALLALEPIIVESAAAARARDPDDFGSAALMVDWMSIRHETQYTRLFRS